MGRLKRWRSLCVCVCALQASRLYQNCPVCLGWFLIPSMSEFLQLPIGSCLCSPNTGPYPSTTTHCLTWFSSTMGNTSLLRLRHKNLSSDAVSEAKAEKVNTQAFLSPLSPCLIYQWARFPASPFHWCWALLVVPHSPAGFSANRGF